VVNHLSTWPLIVRATTPTAFPPLLRAAVWDPSGRLLQQGDGGHVLTADVPTPLIKNLFHQESALVMRKL
jgi:hypothetical protein